MFSDRKFRTLRINTISRLEIANIDSLQPIGCSRMDEKKKNELITCNICTEGNSL